MRALIIVGMAIIITSFTINSLAFDIDGDGKEGLPEAVHALQVAAGIIPPSTDNATVDDVLKGKTFSNSSATGLEGVRPPAPVEKTGQKMTWYKEGDDGFLQKGISWPDPRFSAGEEVVTDNLTGLMWQKSLNTAVMNWGSAINYCNQLSIVEFGTNYQDWRLPNRQELLSLIDFSVKSQDEPILPSDHPFSGISMTVTCWASTSVAGAEGFAWYVWFASYSSVYTAKESLIRAWCVRGGN